MRYMTKGANVVVSDLTEKSDSLTVTLNWTDSSESADADISTLLLGSERRVRSDDDFFFYNRQPAEGDPIQLLGKSPTDAGVEDALVVDLPSVAADVSTVVIAASRDFGSTFGELTDVGLTLSDGAGEAIARFVVDDLSTETALVFAELYRRDGGWKFRTVGQGYDGGLGALAADFGVEIDGDEPVPSAESADSDVPTPLDSPALTAPVENAAGPNPTTARESAAETGRRRPSLRTARKKAVIAGVTIPALAEHESWASARLFPTTARNVKEQETRATSILLALIAQVPEFGRRLTAKLNAPAGVIEAFTEVVFPYGDEQLRPDGVVKVARAGRTWTALLEVKTNGNPLRSQQVEAYIELARKRGYDAVVTLSNELALPGEHPVPCDGRKLQKVALRHLSWAEVTHEVHMLSHHDGVIDKTHLWLLTEYLAYLRHESSGCQGFENMGPSWVPVRDAIRDGTLLPTDRHTTRVVENWEKAIRQLCLRLSGELGVTVAPVGQRRTTSQARREVAARTLATDGRLQAKIRVPGPIAALELVADLRTGRIETTGDLRAPSTGRQLTRARWLLRQLAEAPQDLRIESLVSGRQGGPRELLARAAKEEALLVPSSDATISGFRLTLSAKLGTKRGAAELGFVRSVEALVDTMMSQVLRRLKAAPQTDRDNAADEQ